MAPDEQGRDVQAETADAGEGTWTQGAGEVAPVEGAEGDAGDADVESDALGRDPAETVGHTRNEGGELVSEGAQPEEKGHGDAELEEREDQVTGPGGVQRDREADAPAVFDPGRVGLEPGDDRNPSDPASYPSPDEQRTGTSRVEPDLADGGRGEGGEADAL